MSISVHQHISTPRMKIYQIDAFASEMFTGNPAAVCPLESWLSDELMQKIAAENNLAETAFLVKKNEGYEIRWFTPKIEVDLCGHATLAAAYTLMEHLQFAENEVILHSPHSGKLSVRRRGERYTLNFPADNIVSITPPVKLLESLNHIPLQCYQGKMDYMLVFQNQQQIIDLNPDFKLMGKVEARGIICTAPGEDCDFVSRFFGPQSGIDEDPVTGSAHTTLIPYWAAQLKKETLTAKQLSKRGGTLYCQYLGDRVEIGGTAKTYLIGEIQTS